MSEQTAPQLEKGPQVWRTSKVAKATTMYLTMVLVSTLAIYMLEHSSLINAIRTALVAAVAKTFAANWVSGLFD